MAVSSQSARDYGVLLGAFHLGHSRLWSSQRPLLTTFWGPWPGGWGRLSQALSSKWGASLCG